MGFKMAQIITKFIADSAVTEAKINNGAVTENKIGSAAVTEGKIYTGAVTVDKIGAAAVTDVKLHASAKQSVLESKLVCSRDGVLGVLGDGTSSLDVTTQIQGVSPVGSLTPQTDETAGKGVYVGSISGATDWRRVQVRIAGTDNGIDDGTGDEVYGQLTGTSGSYSLAFKMAAGGSYNLTSGYAVDFYFVETFDFYTAPIGLGMLPVAGVIDATSASAITNHIANPTGAHAASAISYNRSDINKKNIQAASDDVESALTDLDDAIGTLVSPTNYTPSGATVTGHFQGIDTEISSLLGYIGTKADDSIVVKSVNGVNPITGAVTLVTDDIDEGVSPTNLWFTDGRAKTAAVVNSTSGSETDQAPSVSATNLAIASAISGLQGNDCISYSSGSGFSVDFATISALGSTNPGNANGQLEVLVDAVTIKINATNQLEGLKGSTEVITMTTGYIADQHFDLVKPVSVGSVILSPKGGPVQVPGTDYTISYTGGSGGVTRITLAGDLATAGAAALVSGDILVINYLYLT